MSYCPLPRLTLQDFNVPSSENRQPVKEGEGEGSDTEAWEDDGWGTFDAPSDQTVSSGADFFDTFQGSVATTKSKSEDFFESLGVSSFTTSRGKERSPPPPVSVDLFGGTSGSRGKERSPPPPVPADLFGGESESSGWGDWGEEFPSRPTPKVSQWVWSHSKMANFHTMSAVGIPECSLSSEGYYYHHAAVNTSMAE